MRIRYVGVVAMLVLSAAACGSSSSKSDSSSKTSDTSANPYGDSSSSAAPSTTAAPTSAAPVKIGTVDGEQHVVDGKGLTVYAFTPDSATASQCNTGCDSIWPPVTVDGTIPSTIQGMPVSTLTRSDGKKQLVVNGHPVYTYSGDTKPGTKNGQGVLSKWYYLDDKGAPDKG